MASPATNDHTHIADAGDAGKATDRISPVGDLNHLGDALKNMFTGAQGTVDSSFGLAKEMLPPTGLQPGEKGNV